MNDALCAFCGVALLRLNVAGQQRLLERHARGSFVVNGESAHRAPPTKKADSLLRAQEHRCPARQGWWLR